MQFRHWSALGPSQPWSPHSGWQGPAGDTSSGRGTEAEEGPPRAGRAQPVPPQAAEHGDTSHCAHRGGGQGICLGLGLFFSSPAASGTNLWRQPQIYLFFFSPPSNFAILLPHAPLLLPANLPRPTQFIPVYVLGVLGGSYPRTPPPPPPPPPGPAGRPPSTAPSPGPPASSRGAGGSPACCRGARPSRRRGGSTPSASLGGTGAVTPRSPCPTLCSELGATQSADPAPQILDKNGIKSHLSDFKFSPPNFTTECLQRAAPHQWQREGTSPGHEHLPILPSLPFRPLCFIFTGWFRVLLLCFFFCTAR